MLFFNMKSLYYLNLSYNHLTALPPSISTIQELETLLLEGNELQDLPSLESHDMLIKLDLSDNNLSALHFDISKLEDLKILILNNNFF